MILTIKQEPKRLLLLTISLAARTHLVKMNTYSKLLYLLQSLPVLMPQAFIRKCDIHFEIQMYFYYICGHYSTGSFPHLSNLPHSGFIQKTQCSISTILSHKQQYSQKNLKIWKQFSKQFNILSLPISVPLHVNDLFPLSTMDKGVAI